MLQSIQKVPESFIGFPGGEAIRHAEILLHRGRGLTRDLRAGEYHTNIHTGGIVDFFMSLVPMVNVNVNVSTRVGKRRQANESLLISQEAQQHVE